VKRVDPGAGPATLDESDDCENSGLPRLRRFLVVLLNGFAPMTGSARIDLEDVRCIDIGRGDEFTIHHGEPGVVSLLLPGASLSSRHATLTRDRSQWVLEDHASRNGTRIGGARITRAQVGDRDVIEFGRTFAWLVSEPDDRDDGAGDISPGELASLPVGLRSVIPHVRGDSARLFAARPAPAKSSSHGPSTRVQSVRAPSLRSIAPRSRPHSSSHPSSATFAVRSREPIEASLASCARPNAALCF
jgi:FHA domain